MTKPDSGLPRWVIWVVIVGVLALVVVVVVMLTGGGHQRPQHGADDLPSSNVGSSHA
jgi:hypothetical protein